MQTIAQRLVLCSSLGLSSSNHYSCLLTYLLTYSMVGFNKRGCTRSHGSRLAKFKLFITKFKKVRWSSTVESW